MIKNFSTKPRIGRKVHRVEVSKVPKPKKTKTRGRWTILGVDEKAITAVKTYADDTRMSVGKALSKIILEALRGD